MRLPKPTLCANFDSGEGHIGNLDNWNKLDWLLRADLLKDWIYFLEIEYEKALNDDERLPRGSVVMDILGHGE